MGNLSAIAQVLDESAVCNTAQLVAQDNGEIIVTTFDWASSFTPNMKKI